MSKTFPFSPTMHIEFCVLSDFAEIYDGVPRSEAARAGGAGVQIVRDWVLRFNAEAAGH
ncbi:MAG: hypothetical protein WCC90_03545 [Methylocella sp.]